MLFQTDCVLGIGANLGDRERTFAWALERLQRLGQVVAISNVYENPAVGGPPQPDYLNAAIRLKTRLPPLALLEATQHIELIAGRERSVHWGPRTLDLDLLWIPGIEVSTSTLQIPHPRLLERPFALLPLIEVAPAAREPATGVGYASVMESRRTDELRLHLIALTHPWRWQRLRGRPRHSGASLVLPEQTGR